MGMGRRMEDDGRWEREEVAQEEIDEEDNRGRNCEEEDEDDDE